MLHAEGTAYAVSGLCQMAGIWLGPRSICEPTDPFRGRRMQKRNDNGAWKCLELGRHRNLAKKEPIMIVLNCTHTSKAR